MDAKEDLREQVQQASLDDPNSQEVSGSKGDIIFKKTDKTPEELEYEKRIQG